jgi:anti-sigma B factor antagonist
MPMTLKTRAVTVKQFPQTLNATRRRSFLDDVKRSLNVDRPCLVLDCSARVELDRHDVFLLLCCLEEAIKRNGDVRLAGVSQEALATLESTGVDRLFRIFDSSAEAESSFRRGPAGPASLEVGHCMPHRAQEHRFSEHRTSENAA